VYSEVGAKQDYTVSVLLGASDSKEIKAFWLDSLQATIIGTDILLGIGSDKSYKSLMTDFIHTGSEVRVNGKSVVSGENSFDYSDPVTFTVVARDGSTKDYKVIVSSSNAFSIGGFVSGLGTGKSMILQNNGGDNTTIVANGNFSFNATVPNYGAYTVTVLTQPTNQYCTVTNGTGAANASVTNILVDCNNNPGTTVQSFTDLGDGTIKDNNAGLIWQKCSRGQNSLDCSTVATTANWSTANSYCAGINNLPTTNPRTWKLPSRDELLSILDYTKSSAPFINNLFPNTQSNYYWSSTSYLPNTSNAWFIDFNTGFIDDNVKTNPYYVRCVSGP
jgi:hypothetical protein